MLNDPLANALSAIKNAEKIGKKELIIKPSSKMIKEVLAIMNKLGYIGQVEDVDSKSIKIHLLSKINNCGVVKPQYQIKFTEFDKFEQRYLLAAGFGALIISTNNSKQSIMTNEEAKAKKIGGKLLAYIY